MNIAVLELEEKIRKIITQDNGRVAVFEYEKPKPIGDGLQLITLIVSTFNEATKEVSIMYKTGQETNKETCLAEVVKYLEVIRPTLSPYTMRWAKKGEQGESTVSYFHCNDMQEVLDKFFATRKKEEYVIFSLEMKGYS